MTKQNIGPRYRFAQVEGPTDLRMEPTARFWEEFPNGSVPIRHIPSTIRLHDFEAWSEEYLGAYEAAQAIDADLLERLRWDLIHTVTERRAGFSANLNRAQAIVVEFIRHGLTLRQIARYTELSLTDVVGWYQNGSTTWSRDMAHAVADAHDDVRDRHLSQAQIARRHSISRKVVARLQALTPQVVAA